MVYEMKKRFVEEIYKSDRTVFRLRDVGMLLGAKNEANLKSLVNYYVSKGVIRAVRKGIYVKEGYSLDELACRVYAPSYVSLDSVLFKAGVIFQFSSSVTVVSYLSRRITVDGSELIYRKIKNSILMGGKGIERIGNASVAIPERAFLDLLYLNKDTYFDNLRPLNRDMISELLEMYQSKALERRCRKVLNDG